MRRSGAPATIGGAPYPYRHEITVTHMDPITDVREISRIAYGFMASKALFAALNVDLFTRLSGRQLDVEQLAAETGIAPNRLESLLTSCVSLGLLTKFGTLYGNAPASERYLVKGDPAYFGDYYRYQIDRQVYPYMERLDAALKGEEVRGLYNEQFADAAAAEAFTVGQHSGSLGPAHMLARAVELGERRTLLDVGGGSGAFTIAFCRRNPEISATILDFAAVIELARRFTAEAGLEGRVAFVAGSALEAEWPGGQDVVLMSYLLSAVGEAEIDALVDRAWDSLAPGGLLILHDFMVNQQKTGPTLAALWCLPMLLGNPRAVALTPELLIGLLKARGFVELSAREMLPDITSLILSHKPA